MNKCIEKLKLLEKKKVSQKMNKAPDMSWSQSYAIHSNGQTPMRKTASTTSLQKQLNVLRKATHSISKEAPVSQSKVNTLIERL